MGNGWHYAIPHLHKAMHPKAQEVFKRNAEFIRGLMDGSYDASVEVASENDALSVCAELVAVMMAMQTQRVYEVKALKHPKAERNIVAQLAAKDIIDRYMAIMEKGGLK